MRKVVIMLLLGMALEVSGFLGTVEFLREKMRTGPVGRLAQEVNQARSLVGKAREVLNADQLTPEALSKAVAALGQGDPSRNPFALPQGVNALNQPTGDLRPPGEAGAGGEKDPTLASRPKPPAHELNGILVGTLDRVAIIDGTLLRTGDVLEGEHVIDIGRDHVVLARDGQRRTLRLPPPFPESGQETGQPEPRSSAEGVQPKRLNGATKP